MVDHLLFNRILLMLLITVYSTQATIVDSEYKNLEPGLNVTGTVVTEFKTRSKLHCSDRLVELTTRSKL